MRNLRRWIVAVVLLALLTVGGVIAAKTLPTKPLWTKAVPMRAEFMNELAAAVAAGEAWPSDAEQVAMRLVHPPSFDAPRLEQYRITVEASSATRCVVDVHWLGGEGGGDSVFESFNHITLERVGTHWQPVSHGVARKGRGRLGWTTRPTM